MKTSPKGFISPLLLALIALLILGGAYVYLQNKQANQPITATSMAQTSSSQTADWNIYTNTKYNYSIRYPKDLYITFDSSPGNQSQSFYITNFKLDLNPSFMGVGQDPKKMMIKGDAYDHSICGGIDESTATVVEVGGMKVKRVVSIATDGGESTDSYAYIVPGTATNCFVITLYPYPIDTDLLQKSDQIISTFKLSP